MSLSPNEQHMLNSFLIGYTQEVDHTLISILFKIVVPDPKEADKILIDCLTKYLQGAEPFLAQASKENINFSVACKETLKRFVMNQLQDIDTKTDFKLEHNII